MSLAKARLNNFMSNRILDHFNSFLRKRHDLATLALENSLGINHLVSTLVFMFASFSSIGLFSHQNSILINICKFTCVHFTYRFPSDPKRRKQWELACRRADLVVNNNSRICSCHFLEADFDRTGQTTRIREGVVPSVISDSSPHLNKVR